MNYAIVYLAFILLVSTVYWYIAGKKFYTGPLIEAEVDLGAEGERSSEEGVQQEKKLQQELRQREEDV